MTSRAKNKENIAIIQARMGSSRLPGKMGMEIGGYSLFEWVVYRLLESKSLDQIILATSTDPKNKYLVDKALELGIESYVGDEHNVLSRFSDIARLKSPLNIVRICADNPLIMPSEIDRLCHQFTEDQADYSFNHIPKWDNEYADGLGAEIINASVLLDYAKLDLTTAQEEHVTRYIWDNPSQYKMTTVKAPKELAFPHIKLDIDSPEDYENLTKDINGFGTFTSPIDFDVASFLQYKSNVGEG